MLLTNKNSMLLQFIICYNVQFVLYKIDYITVIILFILTLFHTKIIPLINLNGKK